MKKTLKKTLSLILAFTLVFSLALPAFAASSSEKIVATLTIYSYPKKPGHCWIYVYNESKKVIDVGAYALVPGRGVSLGTFGLTRYDGWGIYYNVEAYSQSTYGMGGYVTLQEDLTAEELKTLSDGILNYRNSWGIFFNNCVNFAVQMWNLVSEKKLVSLILPSFQTILIAMLGGGSNNVPMNSVSEDDVFRQKGTGSNAYLETVNKASLRELI